MLFSRFYLVALSVLLLDVVTKGVVYRTMLLHGPSIELIGDFVKLTYIQNPGAAFGLFPGNRYFFIGVSILSALVILVLAHGGRYRDKWSFVAFGMILGGALGNLADRIWLGVVIDFINVGFGVHRWPYFNIADSGISIGVVLLAIRFLLENKQESESGELVSPPDSPQETSGG